MLLKSNCFLIILTSMVHLCLAFVVNVFHENIIDKNAAMLSILDVIFPSDYSFIFSM